MLFYFSKTFEFFLRFKCSTFSAIYTMRWVGTNIDIHKPVLSNCYSSQLWGYAFKDLPRKIQVYLWKKNYSQFLSTDIIKIVKNREIELKVTTKSIISSSSQTFKLCIESWRHQDEKNYGQPITILLHFTYKNEFASHTLLTNYNLKIKCLH